MRDITGCTSMRMSVPANKTVSHYFTRKNGWDTHSRRYSYSSRFIGGNVALYIITVPCKASLTIFSIHKFTEST